MEKKTLFCECLDLVEAAHRDRVYPLMYCHMEITGHLNRTRLKQAVNYSAKIIPELLCTYDFSKNCFLDAGYTVDDVVQCGIPSDTVLQPDLSVYPQIQIFFAPQQKHEQITVVMSHLLADGDGFLQYLYLLAALYNGKEPPSSNSRKIAPLLEGTHRKAITKYRRRRKHQALQPLRSKKKSEQHHCITSRISAEDMQLLYQKAKQAGVTLNDIFITAYARVIAKAQNMDTVTLPCPADLRRFSPMKNKLTIANMTGIYRQVFVTVPAGATFDTVLKQVHREMKRQKAERRCFDGIKALHCAFYKIPKRVLTAIIKATHSLSPVSYTNIGVIRAERLCFRDCTVKSCFLTGAYRLPPDFQMTISTFKDTCTLNCTLLGSLNDQQCGQQILEQVKKEIVSWIDNV